jgi:hypothetical protein
VDDFDAQMVRSDAAIAEVNEHRLWRRGDGFEQEGDLFQLFCQRMAIVGVARKCPGADDQAQTYYDGNAGFDGEFIGLARCTRLSGCAGRRAYPCPWVSVYGGTRLSRVARQTAAGPGHRPLAWWR